MANQTENVIIQLKKSGYSSEQIKILSRRIRDRAKLDEAERSLYDFPSLRPQIQPSWVNKDIDINKAYDFAFQICDNLDFKLKNQVMTFDEIIAWIEKQEFAEVEEKTRQTRELIAQKLIADRPID